MKYRQERALELLRIASEQPEAKFRAGQEEAIRHVVERRGPMLLVQRTGWGKSFVYFIATKLFREAGKGPALLISPLLSLMRNQIEAATRMGVKACSVTSDNSDDWPNIKRQLLDNKIDILLISPERLANESFAADYLRPIAEQISLLVVDEAHCISDWGHDFRPDYRLVERVARNLPANTSLLGTTATANERVMKDLESIFGPELRVWRGSLDRSSLKLQTIRMDSQQERLAWLAERVPELPGSGIIYTLTVRDAEQVAKWLSAEGIKAEAYSARAERELKPRLEQKLLNNQLKVLVATTALGMGFDKPDLAFVIHYQAPGSVVAYYQQVGRAGRKLKEAYGVLLSGQEETNILDYFIKNAFPQREDVELVLEALKSNKSGLSVAELLKEVNLRRGCITKTLKLLALESPAPIAKSDTKWQLTAAKFDDGFWERVSRLTKLRHREQDEMQQYVELGSGHMEFLISALDGDTDNINQSPLQPLPTAINTQLLERAIKFLKGAYHPIQPRKQWPNQKSIPLIERAEPGRALCLYGDGIWGRKVQQNKYEDKHFADDLVEACKQLFEEWGPIPAPEWVTCMPSTRHPHLVSNFAKRLAGKLGLPFQSSLMETSSRPEQKTMENSFHQALNIFKTLKIDRRHPLPAGPVLLIDDVVDSRWTLTVATWFLCRNGVPTVWPLTLAMATGNK